MALTRLGLRDFRCFQDAELELDPGTNVIVGENATGKTSVLEAIHVLAQARSFRTPDGRHLVREGGAGFQVTGRVRLADRTEPIGVARAANRLQLRLGGADVGVAELSQALPVRVLDTGAHQLLEGGPRERRRFLDWGVFHVEPSFIGVWRKYQRALRQRNVALRQDQPRRSVSPWTEELEATGLLIHAMRGSYLGQVAEGIARHVRSTLDTEVELTLSRGWPEETGLAEAIERSYPRDAVMGSTCVGPHRADLRITVKGAPAADRVSRGQAKVLAGALIAAQLESFQELTGRHPTLLVDDLPAELDAERRGRLWSVLSQLGAQIVVTTIEVGALPSALATSNPRFHVEHGGRVKVL